MIFSSLFRILLVLVLAILVLFATSYYRILYILKTDTLVSLPPLVGMDIIEASAIINSINEGLDKKIKINIVPIANNDYPKYTVVKQDPEAKGVPIKEGRSVSLRVSMGSSLKNKMPNYINKPFSLVKEELFSANRNARTMRLGSIILATSKDIVKGNIIAQEPKAHSRVYRNTKVNFIVSSGYFKPLVIDNYIGMPIYRVVRYLSDKRIIVSINNKRTSDIDRDGRIVAQNKRKGSLLEEGDAIEFDVLSYHDKNIDYEISKYRVIRFIVPSITHPIFKNKKTNIVDIALVKEEKLGRTILYKGKKRFGDSVVESYRGSDNGSVEVFIDGKSFKKY